MCVCADLVGGVLEIGGDLIKEIDVSVLHFTVVCAHHNSN